MAGIIMIMITFDDDNFPRDRGVVPGVAGGAMATPDFGKSVNPIITRRERLCPTNYYWHPRIFRPSDGPAGAAQVFM